MHPCSEKLDVVRLTFYTAPVSLTCLAPFFLYYEVGGWLVHLPMGCYPRCLVLQKAHWQQVGLKIHTPPARTTVAEHQVCGIPARPHQRRRIHHPGVVHKCRVLQHGACVGAVLLGLLLPARAADLASDHASCLLLLGVHALRVVVPRRCTA